MSTLQLKNTLMSAEPRAVVERIFSAPGIPFIASSMGLVMVAIISSAGMTPLSMRMTTRGKLVWGKTLEGMVMAEKTAAAQRASTTQVMLLEGRAGGGRVGVGARCWRAECEVST